MKRYATVAIAALAAPAAAGAMFIAASGTAYASTTHATHDVRPPAVTKVAHKPAPKPASLDCTASMSNSTPSDHTTTYVDVSTAKGADVTAVAYYQGGPQTQTATANRRGAASIGYAVGKATPGKTVNVKVTVSSGRSHGSCSTSFTPQR
jgi:hypothetical protein